MSSRRNDLIALAFLTVLITLVFSDTLFLGRNLFQRDLTVYHYPMKQVVREQILDGKLPVWNPYSAGGQPMAANPAYEIFYPPQLLILLGSYRFGFALHIVFHIWLGAIGMYLFLRTLELRVFSALFGAICFALGGPLLSLVRVLPFLFTVAWIPLIFLFARQMFLTRKAWAFAATALFLGMQALVGEPTTLLQTWAMVASYAIYRAFRDGSKWKGAAVNTALAVAVVVCGVIVGAAQMIPGLDYAKDTVRSEPFDFSLVSFWSMPWTRPVELAFPAYFRELRGVDGMPKLNAMYAFGDPFIADFYFGILPLLIIVATVIVRPKGSGYVAAVLLLSYVIAVGNKTPLLRWLYEIGIFQSIRYPEKFALTGLLVLIIWAAVLFDRLLASDRKVQRTLWALAVLWTVITLLATLGSSGVRPALPTSANETAIIGDTIVSPRFYWGMLACRGIALLALLSLWKRKPQSVLAPIGFLAFTLLDLRYLQRELTPTMQREFADPPSVVQQYDDPSRRSRLFHAADWEWADNAAMADAFMGQPYVQPWMIRNGLFPRTAGSWSIPLVLEDDFDQTHLLTTAALVESMKEVKGRGQENWREMFESMSNVGYRAVFNSFDTELRGAGNDPKKMNPVSLLKVGPHPRYYFADQMVAIAGREDFVSQLAQGNWTPHSAYVEGEAFVPAAGSVRVLSEEPAEIALQANATGRAFLVVSIAAHRYWSATLDGKAASLRRANVGFQGLEIPAGAHQILLTYHNPLILPSLVASLVAMLVCLAVCVAGLLSRVPRESAPAFLEERPKTEGEKRRGRTAAGAMRDVFTSSSRNMR